MKLQPDFEEMLKALDPNLNVIPHPTNEDMAGIYLDKVYICAVPSNNIFEEINIGYIDRSGVRHRTIPEAVAMVKNFLKQWEDPEFRELMTCDIDKL